MGSGWNRGLKKIINHAKCYFSILGLKIAATAGLFMLLPILLYLVLHEYRKEGVKEVHLVGSSPVFWGGLLLCFVAMMAVLSKIFILPIRRFVRHIGELEKGKDVEPFLLMREDELGYLTHRFEGLHRLVKNELESRDHQLSVLYDFTNAAAGIFDITVLMDNFFKTLRANMDFDIGAYLLNHRNLTEGKIYTCFDNFDEKDELEVKERLFSRVSNYRHDFPKEKIGRLHVSYIYAGTGSGRAESRDRPTHFIDLPLVCFGAPIGIVSLVSYSSKGTDPLLGSKMFSALVSHTGSVIERLLTHISAEEKKLSNILFSMSEGVYIIDNDGRAASINNKGMELVRSFCTDSLECARHGIDALGRSSVSASWEACEFSKVISKIRTLSPDLSGKVYTEEIRNNDGLVVLLSVSNLVTENNIKEGYVVTAKDITEDRLIQKRVMLSSKLAALGEMAAGIAHEVNNPLQVMMANIELLDTEVSEKGIKRLDNLKDGIFRIKGIIKDLLIFAREQTTGVEDIDVNAVIEKVVGIMRNQLKVASIGIELDLDRRALAVRCNKNLFQQVIINLLQNAKDAIEESKKGSMVRIRTNQLPGGIAVVEVADDGPGVPESVIDRIFDPFFTTKDAGKGTGLGLSVSRRIIDGMGGSITVASSSRGTTFTINLLHRRAALPKDDLNKADGDYSLLARKSVIIVDDEEGVLKGVKDGIGQRFLDIDGYNDGHVALDRIMDRDYDFILLDIRMPVINGMELYRKISEAKPYLAERVIFLTGDTENEATESFVKLSGCRCLAKPFALKELLNIMCEYDTAVGA
ncbi:MAG: response regulator [Deltaproteobacteria bacterium]|nr:response regulator [Deltaproteobacteria bacterium]